MTIVLFKILKKCCQQFIECLFYSNTCLYEEKSDKLIISQCLSGLMLLAVTWSQEILLLFEFWVKSVFNRSRFEHFWLCIIIVSLQDSIHNSPNNETNIFIRAATIAHLNSSKFDRAEKESFTFLCQDLTSHICLENASFPWSFQLVSFSLSPDEPCSSVHTASNK